MTGIPWAASRRVDRLAKASLRHVGAPGTCFPPTGLPRTALAKDRVALSRGLQGLFIRIARGLNRLWERKGSVFADRFHAVILKAPRQVRNTLLYVLQNCWRHGSPITGPDDHSTGPWFDGWRERIPKDMRGVGSSCTAHPRTWLLEKGWRRSGLLSVHSIPGAEPP